MHSCICMPIASGPPDWMVSFLDEEDLLIKKPLFFPLFVKCLNKNRELVPHQHFCSPHFRREILDLHMRVFSLNVYSGNKIAEGMEVKLCDFLFVFSLAVI